MKKIIVVTSLCLILGITYYISLPDYLIYNSTSDCTSDTRNARLNIIIYKYWDIKETVRTIEMDHNTLNGLPSTLEINLYYSKWQLQHGEPFETLCFKYN